MRCQRPSRRRSNPARRGTDARRDACPGARRGRRRRSVLPLDQRRDGKHVGDRRRGREEARAEARLEAACRQEDRKHGEARGRDPGTVTQGARPPGAQDRQLRRQPGRRRGLGIGETGPHGDLGLTHPRGPTGLRDGVVRRLRRAGAKFRSRSVSFSAPDQLELLARVGDRSRPAPVAPAPAAGCRRGGWCQRTCAGLLRQADGDLLLGRLQGDHEALEFVDLCPGIDLGFGALRRNRAAGPITWSRSSHPKVPVRIADTAYPGPRASSTSTTRPTFLPSAVTIRLLSRSSTKTVRARALKTSRLDG